MIRCLFLFINIIIFLCQCTPSNDSNQAIKDHNIHSSNSKKEIDTSLIQFEEFADLNPEKYLNNPDSFINSYHLKPKTAYEYEIYISGIMYMAYELRAYGDHYNSIKYYEKSYLLTEQQQINTIDVKAHIIKPLASLYTLIDDNKKAISLLEKTLVEIPTNQHEERNGYINNLANAYFFNNEVNKAETLLLNEINKPISSLSKALVYNTLSNIYNEKNDSKKTKEYNQLALRNFEQNKLIGDTLIWYSSALGQYGELNNNIHSIEKAIHILKQNFPNSQHRTKAKLQLLAAGYYYNSNKIDQAKNNYQHIIALLSSKISDKYVLDYTFTQALLGLSRSFKAQGRLDTALAYYQWTIENDFRTQQLITSKSNQLSNNIWSRQIIDETSQLIKPLLTKNIGKETAILESFLWCVELSKGRLLINEINRSENWAESSSDSSKAILEIRNLYKQLNIVTADKEKEKIKNQIDKIMIDFNLSEQYFEQQNYIPDRHKFLINLKNKKTDFYSYFIDKSNRIHVLSLINHKISYQKIIDSTFLDSIKIFKEQYFGSNPNHFNNAPKYYQSKANTFVKELLPAIKSTAATISISLDGALFGLPFDALYDTDYLVKTHNFSYLNSFILLELLHNSKVNSSEIALLYRSTFPKHLPDLNFVEEEVKKISQLFKSKKIPPSNQSDKVIVQNFNEHNIIHIASHTIMDKDENPIIYLQHPISTDELRYYNINAPLVFLSACNTGSGKALPSEGMESIQRVFLGKGVPSVISTYWFANDAAMLQLTSSFYEQLHKLKNPILALANAKRDFLGTASIEHQNPWYWANINYAGIGNEIGLKKTSNLSFVNIYIVLIMICSIFLLKYLSSNSFIIKKNKKSKNKPH